MTVLAVKNYNDRIEIATDSGAFNNYRKEENQQKLYEVNNIVIAACGSRAISNLFYLFCSFNSPEGNEQLDILRFYNRFLKDLKDNYNNNITNIENNYFIYYDKKLYELWYNFDIKEIKVDEFSALGAGMQEAKTALYLGHSPKEAISITTKLNVLTAGEIQEKIIYKKEV